LIAVLLLGLLLRFWQLDAKPLWLDEVLTALFTTGHTYRDIPLGVLFPLTDLDKLFAFRSGVGCAQITQTVATESVHPPLFFCLLYGWLNWLRPENWVWALRALPALFGVGTIAALYYLNRLAFSAAAGLAGAALMAVSPFVVYLSQEARHYTLPMLLITLALAGLVQIQQDLASNRFRPWVWLGWSVVNLTGLYTHYFCVIALIGQVMALLGWLIGQKRKVSQLLSWRQGGAIGLAVGSIFLCYLPWLPTLLNHFSRPETDWLSPYRPDWQDRVAPLYQTLVNWLLMVIALPVEGQPDAVVLLWGLAGLIFGGWLLWQINGGVRQLWNHPAYRPPIVLLAGFTLCILLQFFAIVYLLDKDITVVPRYNFVYYPGVCALLGACLGQRRAGRRKRIGERGQNKIGERGKNKITFPHLLYPSLPLCLHPFIVVFLAGILSSMLVVYGFAFQKSYHPDRVARQMSFEPERSLITVMAYESLQEVALGLSFALELRQRYPAPMIDSQVRFAFLDRAEGYSNVWRIMPRLEQPLSLPLNLWVVASPGMRTKNYPEQLRLSDPSTPGHKAICSIDPERFERIGFPYQLFRCQSRIKH
jgi:uncharacterized membrane protein